MDNKTKWTLVMAHAKMIRALVARTLTACAVYFTDSDVEDILSEVQEILVVRALDKFDAARGRLETFIGTVTRNETIEWTRRYSRTPKGNSADATDEDGSPILTLISTDKSAEDASESASMMRLVSDAVSELSEGEQTFYRLMLAHDDDTRAIAQALNTSEGAIRVRRCKLLAKLRGTLAA